MNGAAVEEFINDDENYQQWLAEHRQGFVINTRRSKPTNYMVLHRAICPKISDYTRMAQPGGFTEREYIKICSNDLDSLRNWVGQHGRLDHSFSRTCTICQPIE